MYIRNLNKNINEEDLCEFFGLKSTIYLQNACKVEVIKNKRSGRSGAAPDHVSKELLKLNGETFKERPLTMQEA